MKLKRIILASGVIALSVIFPVSANAVVDTNTYVTSVPNIPATALTAGTCPSGQIVSGNNCVTQTTTQIGYSYTCTGGNTAQMGGGGTYPPGSSFGTPAEHCGYLLGGVAHYYKAWNNATSNQYDQGTLWLIVTPTCSNGSTLTNGSCVQTTVNAPVSNVTTYSCPNGYVLSGVNCMSASYATINATPIWDSVKNWFMGSLIPKVVSLTFIAIGILLAINTVRRNGKKLI